MNIQRSSLSERIIVRALFVVLWCALIGLFLYLPACSFFKTGKQSLNIFTWSNTFDPELFAEFEKETGIKLHYSFYETNEELMVKLEALGGGGYDLIIPSDYAVKMLSKKGLLQPLDKKKIAPFLVDINEALLGHPFDPENTYSLPLEWGIFGIGINKNAFPGGVPTHSWALVFDEKYLKDHKPVAMVNDAKEAVLLVANYLYGSFDALSDEQCQQIKEVLIKQKKYLQMYSDFRADYLLVTENAVSAVSSNAYVWQAMKKYTHVDFFVPDEGSFMTLENIAIPVKSEKIDLVYKLLSFMYTKRVAQHNFIEEALFPAMTSALDDLDLDSHIKELVALDKEKMKKISFFDTTTARSKINDIWIAVKSA